MNYLQFRVPEKHWDADSSMCQWFLCLAKKTKTGRCSRHTKQRQLLRALIFALPNLIVFVVRLRTSQIEKTKPEFDFTDGIHRVELWRQ